MESPGADPFWVDRNHIKGSWASHLASIQITSGPSAATNVRPLAQLAPFTSNGQAKLNETVRVAASAVDPDGLVGSVMFYQMTPSGVWEQFASVTTPPYTANWTPTQVGTYQVYAYAADTLGMVSSNSTPVRVAVSANAPSASGVQELPDQLANISTRLEVGTGDEVPIAGFIVAAPSPQTSKRVVIRAIGSCMGIVGGLANPTLELHDGTGAVIAANDDWRSTQIGGLLTGDQSGAIQGTGLTPANSNESAILVDLPSGNYTVVMRGAGNTKGIGLVEVYDLDPKGTARLVNISTRGLVGTGDKVMIGGTIVQGLNAQRIMIRANGPSLRAAGITTAIADPTLELHDGNGAIIATNDNWRSDNETEIARTGLAPSQDSEAAILATVLPGNYTAIVQGKNGSAGVSLVEFYHLP
jgi:hypothetical protein